MLLLASSAAFVGLVHSLAPGHWLPVVLMTKSRRWPMRTALLGALTAASGHIVISVILGLVGVEIGSHFFMRYEAQIERYSGLAVGLFGLIYAVLAYFRHIECGHDHSHHGPTPNRARGPFLFLFTLGFSPCVAVLPVFAAAVPIGKAPLFLTMASFGVGVATALMGATALVSYKVIRLDHPISEHYGDVITGLGVMALGVVLFLFPIH